MVEKPFAATLTEADRMINAARENHVQLMINWLIRWQASHSTAKRVLDQGIIGEVLEVHHYDGNRGPLLHSTQRTAVSLSEKKESWFYQKSKGGGSLLDYLGYGVTFGTWFLNGRSPFEITTGVERPEGLDFYEQIVTMVKYSTGLSTFATRWGTISDPWIRQPQPKCGFIIAGSEGTLTSYDLETALAVQTRRDTVIRPIVADENEPPFQNPIQYFVHCLEQGTPIEGPLGSSLCRIGQKIVDLALESAKARKTVQYLE
jgi:glucose-fructose oxidoreductase